MKTAEKANPSPPMEAVTKADNAPVRRIGTFTFGWVLVAAGIVMILALFYPQKDFRWMLKLSPVILISLGTEVLLGSRKKAHLKYDWVAMLLCFLIVCAALVMFDLAWLMLYRPGWVHL